MAIFSLSLKGLTAIVSDHGMDKMVFVLQHSVVLDRRRLSAAIQHRRSSSKIKKDGANHNPSNSLEDLDMEFEDDGAPSNCSRKASMQKRKLRAKTPAYHRIATETEIPKTAGMMV